MESFHNLCDSSVYIDAANEWSEGQTIISVRMDGKEISPVRSFYYPDVLTDVEVWLPAGTFLYDVLYYTTADGEEVRREVYLDKNGSMITLDGEILADSIRLAAH